MADSLAIQQLPTELVATTQNTRKSGLLQPIMLLSGHEGEIFTLEFSPDGKNIATGSADKSILLFRVYGECENYCCLKGHQNAILELHWAYDSSRIYSCSADSTVAVWDVEMEKRIKKLSGHVAVINACSTVRRGPPLVASGSDDGTVKIWDIRTRRCSKTFEHQYQILSVTFDDPAQRVFAGSLDNNIWIYDLRADVPVECFQGHTDSITGLDVSKDGSYLLSNSMDQSIRMWNIQPYFSGKNRCISMFSGSTHSFEKNLLRVRWNFNDQMCAAGSADRFVYCWNVADKNLLYKLPGHHGSINEVCFHPSEPIIASGSSDRTVFMGELG